MMTSAMRRAIDSAAPMFGVKKLAARAWREFQPIIGAKPIHWKELPQMALNVYAVTGGWLTLPTGQIRMNFDALDTSIGLGDRERSDA
jgi:hypothetical protein